MLRCLSADTVLRKADTVRVHGQLPIARGGPQRL